MNYITHYPSPVGILTLCSDGEALTGLWIEGQKYFKDTVRGPALEDETPDVLAQATDWLDRYFAGGKPAPDELLLRPAGSDFRQAVWKILCTIPYGGVMTYGQIARMIAQQIGRETMSAQAVGGAVGHNPVSIIIPCHRVVGSSGSLTGYAAGVDIKRRLLEHEGLDMRRFH